MAETISTVRVPPELESQFAAAERVVGRFFTDLRRSPERGAIEIGGDRYVLVRAEALSVDLFQRVRELYGAERRAEADELAGNLLFDLAHAIGRSDARQLHARMGLVDPAALLSAGPVRCAHVGWARLEISPESRVEAGDGFCLVYELPYSFEADAWLRSGRSHDAPACVMNAGYGSGWCAESFGLELVAFEITCRARGDDACRFVMAPPARIRERVEQYLERKSSLPRRNRISMPDFFSRGRTEAESKRLYDLLDVARLETAKVELHIASVDLAQLVRQVSSYFGILASERQVQLSVDAPEEVLAEADADALQRIFANLLSNAFQATPPGGWIRCSVTDRPADDGTPWVRVVVADNGPGVRDEQLSIARELVELHGGRLGVDGEVGQGAWFVLDLPKGNPSRPLSAATAHLPSGGYARASADVLRTTPRPSPEPPIVGANDRPLVLVVDDSRAMNRFLVERLAGEYRVASAYDGEEGLEKALSLRPDVIVTDLMMPRMSGEDLVRNIRSKRELDNVPILVVTARPDEDLLVSLLRGGALDFLIKPFALKELEARLANLVSLKRARESLQAQLASEATDLAELAARAAKRDRELTAALDALHVAREQAERASGLKSNLLSMVSHEFLTPLATQKLCIDLITRDRSGALSPIQAKSIERIREAMERQRRLVESLLEHARVESGRLSLDVAAFDLAALADDVLGELRMAADARKLTTTLACSPNLPPLTSDARLTRLVLVNLVSNALKFTDRGSVEVRLEFDGAVHTIRVRDTGRGIPEDRQDEIFDAFVQLDPARRQSSGVGLGLALIKELVEALSGHIELESREGAGSTFSVSLPQLSPGRRSDPHARV